MIAIGRTILVEILLTNTAVSGSIDIIALVPSVAAPTGVRTRESKPRLDSIAFTPDALELLKNLIISSSLFFDEFPELGILG